MKIYLLLCATVLMVCACAGLPTASPPHRHVYWDKPHSSAPTWFPEQLTWIQKIYYTLVEHFGSAIASGFGVLFGPLGPFVSSFSQPYISTYVSRLTNDVVARSLDDSPSILSADNSVAIDEMQLNQPSQPRATETSDVEQSSQLQERKTYEDKDSSQLQEGKTFDDEELDQPQGTKTSDVEETSPAKESMTLDDKESSQLQESKIFDDKESSQLQESKTSDDVKSSQLQDRKTFDDEESKQFNNESSEEIANVDGDQLLIKDKRVFSLLKDYDDHYFRPKKTENV